MSARPGAPSTTPNPQRVSPGSTPSTRTPRPPRLIERSFDTLRVTAAPTRQTRHRCAPGTVNAVSAYDLSKRRRGAVRPSPIFLAFLAAAAVAGGACWRDNTPGSRTADFAVFVFVLAGWVVSLCLHEFGHAYTAYRAGDHSVEAAGYLTLNPFKYAHPVLSIVLPLVFIVQGGIGLPGGAVYLHRHAFRSRAMQSLAAAAGPLSNVVFAVVLLTVAHGHTLDGPHGRFWAALAFLGFLQVTAAVLNLLPVPGLDGYAIIEPYLDPATVQGAEKLKPWGMIGVIVLLQIRQLNVWFFDLVNRIYDVIGPPAGPFRLSDFGHEFFKFWQKQPL